MAKRSLTASPVADGARDAFLVLKHGARCLNNETNLEALARKKTTTQYTTFKQNEVQRWLFAKS